MCQKSKLDLRLIVVVATDSSTDWFGPNHVGVYEHQTPEILNSLPELWRLPVTWLAEKGRHVYSPRTHTILEQDKTFAELGVTGGELLLLADTEDI